MNNQAKAEARIQELDRTYDLLLILVGMLAATHFQYSCTVIPLGHEIGEVSSPAEVIELLNRTLRLLFAPLIIALSLWMITRLSRGKWKGTAQVSFLNFSFSFLIFDLGYLVSNFIASSYTPEFDWTARMPIFVPTLRILSFLVFFLAVYISYSYLMAYRLSRAKRELKENKRITSAQKSAVVEAAIISALAMVLFSGIVQVLS